MSVAEVGTRNKTFRIAAPFILCFSWCNFVFCAVWVCGGGGARVRDNLDIFQIDSFFLFVGVSCTH